MILSDLDPLIAKMSLLKHPFYVRWSKGELTKQDLAVYAKEYFRLVERIPGMVSRIKERVQDPELKAKIAQNEVEEQEHVELWKRFAKSLDVSEAELAAYEPSATVQDAVASLESLMEQGAEQGITAMYALEAELPIIAQTKKDGLSAFYGLTSADAQVYFDEHMLEEKHLQVWRSFTVSDSAEESARASLIAQNQVLDGVCEACGIPLHC
jgi:pyrroloquinoline-quinone synthase